MSVRMYTPEDFAEVSGWAKERGQEYSADLLPPTGVIIPGIAAYFLYTTNSKTCFLENLISNPNTSSIERDKAIEVVTHTLVRFAREQGYTVAYACTNAPIVVLRALRQGASAKGGYTLLQLKLN